MATKSAKRSLRNISSESKMNAIRRVHEGESKASVARDIGVPESTLRGWCKNEIKINQQAQRQSSPETDESVEIREKRPRIEELMQFNQRPKIENPMQPFNVPRKSSPNFYNPSSESLYTPISYAKNDMDCTPKTPQHLSIKNEMPKSTASQERNRAELARLSIELGLNRPEMYNANNTTLPFAEVAANLTLLTQLNLLMHQPAPQQKKMLPDSVSPGSSGTKQPAASVKPPKEQQSPEEYINGWLKAQEVLVTPQRPAPLNGIPTTTTSANTTSNPSFWNWCKKGSYQNGVPVVSEKPILYQQLTKEGNDAENGTSSSSNKKSVLDNLLHNNNNNNNDVGVEKKMNDMSYEEAIEHGEKFLKWLESCSNPAVTAMQIMQLRGLLSNVKNSVERKNGDLQNKTKVKRK